MAAHEDKDLIERIARALCVEYGEDPDVHDAGRGWEAHSPNWWFRQEEATKILRQHRALNAVFF